MLFDFLDSELSLIITAMIDRRVMLRDFGLGDKVGVYQALMQAATDLENKCSLELLRRERALKRLDNLRSENRL